MLDGVIPADAPSGKIGGAGAWRRQGAARVEVLAERRGFGSRIGLRSVVARAQGCPGEIAAREGRRGGS